MQIKSLSFIASLLLFQLQWWLCISSGRTDYALWGILAFLLAMGGLIIQCRSFVKLGFVLLLTVMGVLHDTLLMVLHVLSFRQASLLLPLWLMVLWFCFSCWFIFADWLNQRYLAVALLFSFGGAGSYYFGTRLGIMMVPQPAYFALIGLGWGCLGLIFVYLIRRYLP